MSKTIFMYGSCVTRDGLPAFEAKGVRLSRYVARQSIISAMAGDHALSEYVDKVSLASKFQREALIGDLSGSLLPELRQGLPESSYLIMDLVEERNGVWIDSLGKRATNSLELNQSGVLEHWDSGRRLISFGSDEHFELWSASISAFVSEVMVLGAGHRASFIKARWATEGIEGDSFPFNTSKLDPSRMNAHSQRYFDYIEQMTPFHLLEVPKELCLTTRRHQWGIAPYHYVPEFYNSIASATVRRIESLDGE